MLDCDLFREPKKPANLILLGETGSGKSATGNVILSAKERSVLEKFPLNDTSNSGTKAPDGLTTMIQGREVVVQDTMGYGHQDDKMVKEQTRNIFENSKGFDAILMVLRCHENPTRVTQSTLSSIKMYNSFLGDGMWKYSIFVTTHGDCYRKYLKELKNKIPCNKYEDEIKRGRYSQDDKTALGPYVGKAKGGAVLFDNLRAKKKPEEKKKMVGELMSKVETLQKENSNIKFKEITEIKEDEDIKKLRKENAELKRRVARSWCIIS